MRSRGFCKIGLKHTASAQQVSCARGEKKTRGRGGDEKISVAFSLQQTDVKCLLYFLPPPASVRGIFVSSCSLDSRQLTSLLLRWTDAHGDDDGEENSVGTDVAAREKAVLVAAGLKTVRVVCTKADNNKGERAS